MLHVPFAEAASLTKPPNNLGLVGYWSFEDCTSTKATDFSGNRNTGTLSGFALSGATSNWVQGTSAKRGCALNFDGANDLVNAGSNASIDVNTNFSVSAWVKTTDNTRLQYAISKINSGTGWGLGIIGGVGGSFSCANNTFFVYNIGANSAVCATIVPTNNTWYHVAFTNTGGTSSLYINGVFNNSGAQTFTNSDAVDLYVGSRADLPTSYNWLGSIDEARIYNRALGANEIANLYSNSAPALAKVTAQNNNGLVGYWSFEDCQKDKATDFSGNRNTGTLSGFALSGATSNWVQGTLAKRGCALNFDGSNDYVDVGSAASLNLTSNMTFSGWFKANGDYSSSQGFIGNSNSGGSAGNYNVTFGFTNNKFEFWNSDSGPFITSTTSIADNTWHHYVATRSGTSGNWTFNLYIDGVLDKTGTNSGDPTGGTYATAIGRLGGYTGTEYAIKGTLDEVRIYNRALGAAEIANLYSSGNPSLVRIQAPSSALTAGTNLATGLVGHWTFDGSHMTGSGGVGTAIDATSNHNNGTLTNGPTRVLGKLGQALNFDGVNDSVSLGNITIPTTAGTVSLFFKSPTNLTGTNNIPLFRAGLVSPVRVFDMYILNGLLDVGWYNGHDHRPTWTIPSSMAKNIWHQIVATWINGGDTKIYVDGNEVTPYNTSYPLLDVTWDTSTGASFIGRDNLGTGFATGSIDDVRIYNRALSAAEVKQLYNLGR